MAEDYKDLVYFSPGLSASKDHAYNTDKMILSFYYLFSSSLFFYPEICLLLTLLCSFDRSQAAYNLEDISTLVKIMNYVMDRTQGYKKSTEGSERPKGGERDCSWRTLGSLPGGGDIMIIRIICSSSSSSMGRVYFLFQRCKV